MNLDDNLIMLPFLIPLKWVVNFSDLIFSVIEKLPERFEFLIGLLCFLLIIFPSFIFILPLFFVLVFLTPIWWLIIGIIKCL